MEVSELAELTGHPESAVKKALQELKKGYDEKEHSSLTLLEDGNTWKLTVKDKYISMVSKVVQQTELSTSVLETLAVIAFKYPIFQSEVIKIRTTKAYDHLAELEEAGFITRERSGRTRKIRLTQKFFDYFDVPESKMKEAFAKFEAVEDTIIEKENEVTEQALEKQRKEAAARNEIEEEKEKIGPLEVYDEVADQIGTSPVEVHDKELSVDLSKEKTKQGERKELEDALSHLSEMRESETLEDAESLDIDNLKKNGNGDELPLGEDPDEGKVSSEGDGDLSQDEKTLNEEEPDDTSSVDPFFDNDGTDEGGSRKAGRVTDTIRKDIIEEEMEIDGNYDKGDEDVKEDSGKELFGAPNLDDEDIRKKKKKSEDDLDQVYREVEKSKDELIGKINKGNLNPE